jgi:drug/metabolite transporter (DMT)-like permease
MNMAELSAVVLISPLIITALAAILFGDPVGWRRWCAIGTGLAGALMIVRPNPHVVDVWALIAVAAAVFSAARDLITRRIHPAIPTLVVSLYGALAVMLSGAALGVAESWRLPDALQWLGIVVSAIFLGFGSYLAVLGFRDVDIAVVAPFRYTLLLWMGLSAYFVFGELPDRWSIAGALLIAAGGLYALHREAMRRRELAARALPPA